MSPQASIQIAIVSDDGLFRDCLFQVLSVQPDFIVTRCHVASGSSLSPLARTHDIILADARSECGRRPERAIPEGGIVIFVGASEDDEWATSALSAGARGLLTLTANSEELVNAIRTVKAGGIWARRRWLNACVLKMVGAAKRRLSARDVVDTRLSRREREVLQHAATGVGNKELADRLSISEATVKVHLTHIFQKLGVPGRAALAANYHEVGSTTNGVSQS